MSGTSRSSMAVARAAACAALAAAGLPAQAPEKLLGGGLGDLLEKGGLVMVLILAGSVFGLALAFERMVALRRRRLAPPELLDALRRAAERGDLAGVERLAAEHQGPLARVLAAGLKRRHQGPEAMERTMVAAGSHEVARLKRPVRPLAVLATVEPLLGLLGTILGMISTFNMLGSTSATERVARLAPGIGQALYTTAAGLCAAIPFVLLYHLLAGRVNRAAEEWSAACSEVVAAASTPVEAAPVGAV